MLIDSQTLESLKNMKRKKGSTSVDAFTDGKLKLVNDILLYYNFLCQDGEIAEANDPTLWDKDDFRKWKSDGFPLSTNALNATQAGNNAYTASLAGNAITITSVIHREIVSNKKVISNISVIHNNSQEERTEPKDVV